MAVVNISVPDQMKEYIDERLLDGNFSTASEYIRNLVREDQKKQVQEKLETLLLAGLEGGESIDITDEYIKQKRADILNKRAKNG
jgi:antitoxin ParD1/3/4